MELKDLESWTKRIREARNKLARCGIRPRAIHVSPQLYDILVCDEHYKYAGVMVMHSNPFGIKVPEGRIFGLDVYVDESLEKNRVIIKG